MSFASLEMWKWSWEWCVIFYDKWTVGGCLKLCVPLTMPRRSGREICSFCAPCGPHIDYAKQSDPFPLNGYFLPPSFTSRYWKCGRMGEAHLKDALFSSAPCTALPWIPLLWSKQSGWLQSPPLSTLGLFSTFESALCAWFPADCPAIFIWGLENAEHDDEVRHWRAVWGPLNQPRFPLPPGRVASRIPSTSAAHTRSKGTQSCVNKVLSDCLRRWVV